MTARKFSACLLALLLTASAFAFASFGARAEQSGADPYAYFWTDSNAPSPSVAFDYVHVNGSGNAVGFYYSDDSYGGPFPIGFDFSFYGTNYSAFNVSSNGYIQFGGATSTPYHEAIPNTNSPNNVIAPFWDNLLVNYPSYPYYSYGDVYYQTFGVAPDRYLVVEFFDVSVAYTYEHLTFEVILNETGEIWFQYLSMSGQTGDTAAIGIENSDGVMGCQYSYETASVSDGLAVKFERGLFGFGPDSTVMADWGTDAQHTLAVTNAQAVTDSFDIVLESSYMGWTVALFDTSWVPLVDNNGDAGGAPDTGDLAPGESFTFYALVTVPLDPADQNETTVLLASSFLNPVAIYDYATLTTKAYQAHFAPFHSSVAVDPDSDDDYDSLLVNISVDALTGGDLELYMWLYDSIGHFIQYQPVAAAVPAGISNITVTYSGETIYSSEYDGPYQVWFELDDRDGNYLAYDELYTAAYLYTDFEPPPAAFVGSFVDYAVDGDSNSLYDYLALDVTVEVFDPGDYIVRSYLLDAASWDTLGFIELIDTFDADVHALTLEFSSYPINESTLDGQCYVYLDLYMADYTWLDEDYDYTAGSYLHSDFEGRPASFAPPHDDYGDDTDGDGYYNELVIELYIYCGETGLYDLEAWVYDPWGDLFTVVYETLSLTAGLTVFYEISLDSETIWWSGISGYYDVEMYLYDNDTHEEVDGGDYETDYYYSSDFDPIGAYIDSFDDYGEDTDLDGYYNELVFVVYIVPLSSGDFLLEAYVYDHYDGLIGSRSEVVYLEEGVTYEWEVVLTAYEVLTYGSSGYFEIDAYIYDETGMTYYDGASHVTSYYPDSLFDPIGAFFEPPHSDYGRDDDSDGYYDCLVLLVYVLASTSGYYDLLTYVYDPGWTESLEFLSELYLEEGEVTAVEVEIPASAVWYYNYDGQWHVYIYLSDHYSSVEYDSNYYDTAYYDVYEFDPPPVVFDPPHADYGDDTDYDTYYDYLVIEAEMYCNEAGTYTVHADLYDYDGYFVTSMAVTESMTFGNEMVEFAFDGWVLNLNGVSGYYHLELMVEDEDGDIQDFDEYYTNSYYYYWEFEGPPAGFYWPHSDYAVDEDEDSLYDYLVVNASIEVYAPGGYAVVGYLYDYWYDLIDVAMAESILDVGVNELQLWYDAWSIAVQSYDPYYVDLVLYDESENEMDWDSYDLGTAYSYTDFDPSTPTIESGWAYEAPAIDGSVGADEWFGADVVDLSDVDSMNDVDGTMHIINDGEYLYILVDATGDLSETDGDMASVAFDTGNDDGASSGHEDQFVIEASEIVTFTTHLVYSSYYGDWVPHCEPFDNLSVDHDGLAAAAGFEASPGLATAHRIYELSIPLALLGVSPGDDIGFGGLSNLAPLVMDNGDDYAYSTWPIRFESLPWLSMYGDLVLSPERPLTTVELTGDDGESGWFVSSVSVALTATGGTGGVANTSYNIDGEGWQTYGSPFVVDDEGMHTVQYYSIDMARNAEPVRTVMVNVDTVAPATDASVEGTVGLEEWVTGDAAVEFAVTESTSGMSMVMYCLDGGDWTELVGTTLPVSEDGTHVLEFYSVDVAGNEEEMQTLEIKVDMNAPVTTAVMDGSSVTLSCVENGSGVEDTWYRIDDGEWTSYEGEFVVRGAGAHTLEYYSVDVAGNNETVKSVSVEGSSAFSLDWWMVVLIGVILLLIAIGAIFGMRRKAKESDSRAQFKDMPSVMAQMEEDTGKPASPEQQTPPTDEHEPPPPDREG